MSQTITFDPVRCADGIWGHCVGYQHHTYTCSRLWGLDVRLRSSGSLMCSHAWQDTLCVSPYRWVFIYEKGYQSTDTAVSSVFTKMKGVGYTSVNGDERIWDVADYVFPSQVAGCQWMLDLFCTWYKWLTIVEIISNLGQMTWHPQSMIPAVSVIKHQPVSEVKCFVYSKCCWFKLSLGSNEKNTQWRLSCLLWGVGV